MYLFINDDGEIGKTKNKPTELDQCLYNDGWLTIISLPDEVYDQIKMYAVANVGNIVELRLDTDDGRPYHSFT